MGTFAISSYPQLSTTNILSARLPTSSRSTRSAILAKATLSVVLGWVGEAKVCSFPDSFRAGAGRGTGGGQEGAKLLKVTDFRGSLISFGCCWRMCYT